MQNHALSEFAEVWFVDFEYRPTGGVEGSLPDVVCLVAHEYRSGRKIRMFADQLGDTPPYPIDESALFVAYYASAEIGCHLALGWPVPVRILDLFCEFRNATNGLSGNNSLLGALMYHGLDHIGADEKDAMRDLILGGGPWDRRQRHAILNYCESDVHSLARLLPAMLPGIDLPRALLRGRAMAGAARMEHVGVPIDVETLDRIERNRDVIKGQLIREVDADYGVYEGTTFKHDKFAHWLNRNNIPWPQTDSGRLKLDEDTFRQMERKFPEVAALKQLRSFMSENRSIPLPVGVDGRNRTLLSAFRSKTGRFQPSNTKAIFGRSAWNRSLIKPEPGYGLAYIDFCQQEVGIAAALSGDAALKLAYRSGDPYLEFGKQAGKIPPDGTRATHKADRDRFKACVLAVQYGMQAESLAKSVGCSTIEARELLRLHRETYPTFWAWSQSIVHTAMLTSKLQTVFGWTQQVGTIANPRSLSNFPMQANGAEMLRLACCKATEEGIRVCAPVHDAVLIEAPLELLDADIERMQAIMAEAASIVLDGFELRTDVETVRYPDRFVDPRGSAMWGKLMALIDEADLLTTATPSERQVFTGVAGPSHLLSNI